MQEQLQRMQPGGSGSSTCEMKLGDWASSTWQNEACGAGYGPCLQMCQQERLQNGGDLLKNIENNGARLKAHKLVKIDVDLF